MRILSLISTLSLLFLMNTADAQMNINGQIFYGNEWINHTQDYYKCHVTEDGIYRISTQTLLDAGVPVSSIDAGDFQLYAMGNQVPMYVSASTLGSSDYIEFYGKQNRGELDVHLYSTPDDQFNPYYSMFTDSMAYFLTWGSDANQFQDIPNDLTALPAPDLYFMNETVLSYNNKYNKGKSNQGLYESRFSAGEGFGGVYIKSLTSTLSTPYAYTSGPDAELSIRFVASNEQEHTLKLSLNDIPIPVNSTNFTGYRMLDVQETFSTNLLSTNTTDVQLNGLQGTNDEYSTSFVKITYPRQFNFDNQDEYTFKIPADAAKKYLEISNFNHGGTAPILYDLTNGLRITTNLNGNIVRVALPPSSTERELVLIQENNYNNINNLINANFIDYSTTQGDYIIISNPLLFDDGAGNNYVEQYANYRSTTGYTPIIITTEQLYDQFAYGISRHSQSVRNLTGYSIDNWTPRPKYMFMIGKSRPYYSVRKNWTRQPAFTLTIGYPSADVLLTATNFSDAPRISFGKLPVTKPDQIRIYLDKVMAHENLNLPQTIEDREWQKRIVHLVGGDNDIGQELENDLKRYEDIIEDEFFGANVTTFSRNNPEPIDYSPTHVLDSLINEGVSMITFHGYSTPNNINYNIRRPEDYNNTNRYPLFISLGAYSGQIHTKTFGLSEQFVFAENKGTIAYMGLTWLAGFDAFSITAHSDTFTELFYQKLSKDNHGEGIGDIHRATLAAFPNNTDVFQRMPAQQMTLNGDPAVRLHSTEAPDYLVRESNIAFAPTAPSTADDIELSFSLVNLGKAENQQVKLLVERILPDGTTITVVNEAVDAPSFEREYSFTIPAITDAVGLNEFVITVDSDNLIVELPNPDAEGNNTATASVFIYNAIVEPFFPHDYAIANDGNNIVLKAEINDRYANQSLNYMIQIDTTALFDSPIKAETTITQTGGILEWTPPINFVEGTVYYWRSIAVQGQVTDAADWENRSFIYLEGEYPGWNQSHHYQFLNNNYNNTFLYNKNTREFEYANGGIEVLVDNAHQGILFGSQIDYSIAGLRIHDMEGCEYDKGGMTIALLDENAKPIWNTEVDAANDIGQYGSYICRPTIPAYTFLSDAAGQQALLDFLTNVLPTLGDVHEMLIYSLNDYQPEMWNPALFAAFADLGLADFQNAATLGAVPYAALISLENNTVQEEIAASETDIIQAIFFIRDTWDNGSMTSTVIGPALEWGSLHWNVTDQEAADVVQVNVYGINENGERTLLVDNITDFDHVFDMDVVDADLYPYLQIEYVSTDPVNQTPPQLDFWRVLYDANPCYELHLTAMLEGAYDISTGNMRTALSNDRQILPGQTPISNLVSPTPAGQPYATAPWNHSGIEGASFTDSNYSGDEVDWVLVSLRTGINKADEVASAAGLLMKDGTIKFPAECPMRTDHTAPLYIVVEHRNHLGIMSPQPVDVLNRDINFDFTTQDSYKDATSTGQLPVASGVWAMLAGDMGQTTDIQSYDINGADKVIWEESNGNFDVYRTSDANLNGDTNGNDKIIWERNNGKSSRVPR